MTKGFKLSNYNEMRLYCGQSQCCKKEIRKKNANKGKPQIMFVEIGKNF